MLLWKVADKSDRSNVQLTDYGWEVNEHDHVMTAISREPAAPSKLMDVISCGCKRRVKHEEEEEGEICLFNIACNVVERVAVSRVDSLAPATLCL